MLASNVSAFCVHHCLDLRARLLAADAAACLRHAVPASVTSHAPAYAPQDTRRVYRDEINLIEVELLGREHGERIAAERAAAEASGAARLQRLQEQLVQTRVKYNRAKYQYYYPGVKGYK